MLPKCWNFNRCVCDHSSGRSVGSHRSSDGDCWKEFILSSKYTLPPIPFHSHLVHPKRVNWLRELVLSFTLCLLLASDNRLNPDPLFLSLSLSSFYSCTTSRLPPDWQRCGDFLLILLRINICTLANAFPQAKSKRSK